MGKKEQNIALSVKNRFSNNIFFHDALVYWYINVYIFACVLTHSVTVTKVGMNLLENMIFGFNLKS